MAILAVAFGLLNWPVIRQSVEFTIQVSGMVFFIILNSAVFSQLLSFSGAGSGLLQWATGSDAPVLVMVLIMFAALLMLGMFMDAVSMMLISVPIFFPLAMALNPTPIWFGIFLPLSLEMSGTTPPFGLPLFIVLDVASKSTTLGQAASAALAMGRDLPPVIVPTRE